MKYFVLISCLIMLIHFYKLLLIFSAICRLSPRIRKFLFNRFFSFALLCRDIFLFDQRLLFVSARNG